MSARNGDKARFGRLRKRKADQRIKNRDLKESVLAKAIADRTAASQQ